MYFLIASFSVVILTTVIGAFFCFEKPKSKGDISHES
jgi:hypothetical protein